MDSPFFCWRTIWGKNQVNCNGLQLTLARCVLFGKIFVPQIVPFGVHDGIGKFGGNAGVLLV